jgi:signal transduction histidine kinase
MPHNVNFTDICNQVLESIRPFANAKNITVINNRADEVCVFADSDMLKTVLRNLISNAIKFTNPGGEVTLKISQSESLAESASNDLKLKNKESANFQMNEFSDFHIITLSDNGIGIAPDKASKLFEILQVHSTMGTANESGTGLGLLLCKGFVEKHGGRIWVESKEGKGSEFKFSLPIGKKE